MTGAFDFQDSSPANNEPQVNIHPMEVIVKLQSACIQTELQLQQVLSFHSNNIKIAIDLGIWMPLQ